MSVKSTKGETKPRKLCKEDRMEQLICETQTNLRPGAQAALNVHINIRIFQHQEKLILTACGFKLHRFEVPRQSLSVLQS